MVEYGIVVAVIVFAAIGGLSALQGAEAAYFTGFQSVLSPTPIPCGSSCTSLVSYSTAVVCPASSYVNGQASCTVTVQNTSTSQTPTGTVTWTSDSSGGFTGNPCNLVGSGGTASCTVVYQPSVIGNHTLTATYNVVPQLPGTIASATIVVSLRPTTTGVVCNPGSNVMLGTSTTCTATVTDAGGSGATTPSGSIAWTSSGTGTFSGSATCNLSAGACQITYTPTALGSGTHVITGTYCSTPCDGVHGTSSGAYNLGVVAITTTTAVSCTPSPVDANVTTTCTATVTGGPTPSGTVSWTFSGPGSPTSGSCTLSAAGTCQVTYTPSAAGAQSLTAAYAGDATHAASNSGTVTLNVNQRSSGTSVSCTPNPITYDGSTPSSNCTATVTDTDSGTKSTPSGTITWSLAAGTGSFGSGGTCTLSGTSCSVSFTPGSAGSDTIRATYSGDALHATSSGTGPLTVNKRSTSTSVSCTPDPSTFDGSPASPTCTATVTDTTGGTPSTPTGSVTWTLTAGAGAFNPASCSLDATGHCSVSFTPGGPGADTIQATYAGDTNHAGSSGSGSLTVNSRSTSTAVSCSPDPIGVNGTTFCTATVTDTDAGTPTTPTGTVTFAATPNGDGTLTGSPCTLSASGTCTATWTRKKSGSVTITATYSGDALHSGSVSPSFTEN